MADYTKQDIFDIITEYLEQYGSAVGSYSVHELTPEELTDANLRVLTIPGMRPDNQQWVQTSLRNMLNPIDNAVSDLTTLKTETAAARDAANQAAGSAQDAIDAAETATTYANTQANRAKGYNDHPWQIGDDGFIYVWNETSQSMVRTNRMILEFNDLTEEQKQSLIDEFYQTLVFASVEDVRSAINELT